MFFQKRQTSFRTESLTRINIFIIFKAHICFILKQIIKRFDDFNIGIHIYSAVFVNRHKPCHVRHKRILFCFISLLHKRHTVNVKIRFVPFNNFIIRAVFFPAVYALFYAFWLFVSAKPKIMNFFRYHTNLR